MDPKGAEKQRQDSRQIFVFHITCLVYQISCSLQRSYSTKFWFPLLQYPDNAGIPQKKTMYKSFETITRGQR
jgi:hypothetical protein